MLSQKPYVVAITGGSASGKTTLLKELRRLFTEDEVCMICQDNYYKSMENHPRDMNGKVNYDLPQCIDLGTFRKDLERLIQGEHVKVREYRFQHEDQYGGWISLRPAPIVIAEGLFIFHPMDNGGLFDLTVFIEADPEVSLERRIRRDTAERQIPEPEVHYQWENHVIPAYHEYLLPHREKADLVIVNNGHFGNSVKVLEDHFRIQLKKA